MEDGRIIELYFSRNEDAIRETDKKYGGFCRGIAHNILSIREDAEECVSDTWLRTWDSIPPEKPCCLKAWLGRIVRNLSIDRLRKNRAKKRYSGLELMLSELEECIPSNDSTEKAAEKGDISRVISCWLDTLSREDRVLFVQRYWYGCALKELAFREKASPKKLAGRMYKLRQELKAAFEREGISI